ncbi:MAG: MBOAT family protein [Candidatus Margulisbacteria bacterium]|nr:MBOAT family protein [Candidatus Margulisiibacteriota bacterium]
MLFNSLHFLIFFPIVISLYFTINHKYRWVLLLISSYYFYMSWKPEYIIIIMISTLIDYITGMKIYKSNTKKGKKIFLSLSLFSNLSLLFAFKYFNFFSDSVRSILQQFSIPLNPITLKVLLPVGISFYTFQSLSYSIDIYRSKIKPEKHFGIFAVYISFFPQLVAGPIERAKNLLPQFFEKHHFNYIRVTDGLKLMLWGFFKKIVIADQLAIVVNNVFNNVYDYTGLSFIIAIFFFAFQIYCDFSGYSDIAIGSAQIMGFKLMDNFNRPYFSRSISEFWKRWHISLSSWFKDYVYIPLGGNRVSIYRWYVNILIIFVVSGLWHGANWTFVVWGALHGFYYIFETLLTPFKNKLFKIIRLIKFEKIVKVLEISFIFILVNIGWIFFRANNIQEGIYILTHLFSNISFNIPSLNLGVGWLSFLYCLGIIGFMEFVHFIQEHRSIRHLSDKPLILRWVIYFIIMLLILLFGVFNKTSFIYFQF